MKRAIWGILMFLLVMPFAFSAGMARIEWYDQSNKDAETGNACTAQTFTIGTTTLSTNYNLSKITLMLTELAGVTSINVCLVSTSAGAPTTTGLSCNYSDSEIMNLTNTTARFINISMPKYEMQAGVKYAILRNQTGTSWNEGVDDTSPTYSGGSYYYDNAACPTPATEYTPRDFVFEIWSENGTISSEPDTTPPAITYFNLTSSDNGCESWNTDKNTACSTSSVTPSVQFNTSKNAWCAVAGSSSPTSLNINYTQMGSSRNCTGAASGEGTTSHLCTLTNQDEIVYDTSYLFISCKDSSDNMNRSGTSTSGALKLSITGLEAAGRNSIGLGIQNALLSGYTNYTGLQIYARNLSNSQVKGTFDRAAKKGTKMWAFNRIGVSDSHVNMFNLTPVLYTLELANKTSSQITNQVELLINATK